MRRLEGIVIKYHRIFLIAPVLLSLVIGLFVSVSLLLAPPVPVKAVSVGICPDGSNDCGSVDYQWMCKAKGESGYNANCKSYILEFYKYALRLGAILSILMIIYAGYLYVFSQGDTSKLGQAKEVLTGTLLGFLLLLTVGIILNFLGLPSFGTANAT